MVDFTKIINNEDMAQELNQLVRHNIQLSKLYEETEEAGVNEDQLEWVRKLKGLHEQHARKIGDTIRSLGGAPDYEGGESFLEKGKRVLNKLGPDSELVGRLEKEEVALKNQYQSSRQALKASPESVLVINEVLDELTDNVPPLAT